MTDTLCQFVGPLFPFFSFPSNMRAFIVAFLAFHPRGRGLSLHDAFGKNVTNLYTKGGDDKLKFFQRVDTVAFVDVWEEVEAVRVVDEYHTWIQEEDDLYWF